MRFTGIDLHDDPAASFAKVAREVQNPWLMAFYVIGLIAASWHFAYGIWLFCAKWGIVSGDKAQQRLLRLCLAFFVLLAVIGLASLYTFRNRFLNLPQDGNIAHAVHINIQKKGAH
jgi:succinate dehydrogenase / fumarate reductase cytochrome b subunit